MPSNNDATELSSDQINLKHRVTGAGVLIFFGALVLPWLLGPPSEAKKDDVDLVNQAIAERHSTFEDEVLAQLEGVESSFEEPEESVYVSKITPVDGKQVVSEPEKVIPKKLEVVAAPAKAKAKKALVESSKPAISEDKKSSIADNKAAIAKSASSANSKKPALKTTKAKTSAKSATKVVAKPTTKKIDVGWVVQVELLTDKKGAERLVKSLNSKGFDAQTTTVDTNRGKGTGTRIWLGPFEQRAEAGAENDKLNEKMGKRGFIRVYP